MCGEESTEGEEEEEELNLSKLQLKPLVLRIKSFDT